MPAEIESMAYRHEDETSTPWHGLAAKIDHDATPAEMLTTAGLDWTVSKRPLFTPRVPLVIEGQEFETMSVPDYFALVRDSDGKILGPAGKDYVPTQNAQAMDFFKKFCDAGHMRLETAGSLQGGKQVWVLAKIQKSFKLTGDDEVGGYLLFSNPHQWGHALVIKFTPIRVVCMNTLVMALAGSSKGFRAPHVRAFDSEVAKEAEMSLGIATEMLEKFEETANKLAATKISNDVVVRYVADIMQPELIAEMFGKNFYRATPEKQAELILTGGSPEIKVDASAFKRSAGDVLSAVNRQPGAGLESASGTLWGSFNAVAYYCDHVAGISRDNALTSSWFGARATTKVQALRRAVEMVKVASF
jgi:phage/plasmid-like protein (TIGR03299 family)